MTELDVPLLPATNDESDYKGEVRWALLLSNGGNRSDALLSVELEVIAQREEGAKPNNYVCTHEATPGSMAFSGQSQQLPVILAPGDIKAVRGTAPFHWGWDELYENRQVEICVVFTTLDHMGIVRTHRLPLSRTDMFGENHPKRGPMMAQPPEKPFRLL
ncbi:MAG: hypothetical protein V4574_10700 [Pseudomonadota bacterium]